VATLSQNQQASNVSIRAMHRTDLEEARKIFRVAFGTSLGYPNPKASGLTVSMSLPVGRLIRREP